MRGAKGGAGAAKFSLFDAGDRIWRVFFHHVIDADRDSPHCDSEHNDVHKGLYFRFDRQDQYDKHANEQHDDDGDDSQDASPFWLVFFKQTKTANFSLRFDYNIVFVYLQTPVFLTQ